MTEDNLDPAPNGITEPAVETQPQADPTPAPEGTPEADNQAGITDAADSTEEFYQTKYQNTVESQKSLMTELNTYKQRFGPIPPAPADSQVAPATPAPAPAPEAEFDPYDPAQMKGYWDGEMAKTRAQLKTVAVQALTEAREQERTQTEENEVYGKFDTWCAANEIPEPLMKEATDEFVGRFGRGARPHAVVEWISDYIVKKSAMVKQGTTTTQQVTAAVDKGKALAGVQQPAQGAPTDPAAQGATWQQKEADGIAPEKAYVPPQ